jgi:hypothetical protein
MMAEGVKQFKKINSLAKKKINSIQKKEQDRINHQTNQERLF